MQVAYFLFHSTLFSGDGGVYYISLFFNRKNEECPKNSGQSYIKLSRLVSCLQRCFSRFISLHSAADTYFTPMVVRFKSARKTQFKLIFSSLITRNGQNDLNYIRYIIKKKKKNMFFLDLENLRRKVAIPRLYV